MPSFLTHAPARRVSADFDMLRPAKAVARGESRERAAYFTVRRRPGPGLRPALRRRSLPMIPRTMRPAICYQDSIGGGLVRGWECGPRALTSLRAPKGRSNLRGRAASASREIVSSACGLSRSASLLPCTALRGPAGGPKCSARNDTQRRSGRRRRKRASSWGVIASPGGAKQSPRPRRAGVRRRDCHRSAARCLAMTVHQGAAPDVAEALRLGRLLRRPAASSQ